MTIITEYKSICDNSKWIKFLAKGLHLVHLNVSSLLIKICFIAKKENASVNKLSKSKINSSILNSEIKINSCDIIGKGCLKIWDGVVYYVNGYLS